MKIKILFGVGILIAVVLISGCVSTPPIYPSEKEIPFETIEQGGYSSYTEQANLVIKNEKTFLSLWLKVHSISSIIPELPKIDFSKETIVAVFMGGKSTGGYSISIEKIVDESIPGAKCAPSAKCIGKVIVYYKETSPAPGDMVTQAFTQPYHIVKTQKIIGQVEFQKA